jgi:O-antigen/teichoic acid export membrane protein
VNFSFLKVILGIITFCIVFVVSQFIGKGDIYITLILIYSGYAIVNNIAEFLRAFFRPSEQMQHEAYMKIINGLLFMGIVGYTLFVYGTLESIMYGFLVSAVV